MSYSRSLSARIAIGLLYLVAIAGTWVSTCVLLVRLELLRDFGSGYVIPLLVLCSLVAAMAAGMLSLVSRWAEKKHGCRQLIILLVIVPVICISSLAVACHWPTSASLITAIHDQDARHVRLAMWFGVDANSYEYWGWHHLAGRTALSLAAFEGDKEIARLLIDNGADVNMRDEWGETPLRSASVSGNLDLVDLLLDEGANVNDVGGDSRHPCTAFSASTSNGRFKIADRLLEAGADPHLGSVSFAGASGRLERLQYLNALDVDLQECLPQAVWGGHAKCVRYLLKQGCDPEQRDFLGRTADQVVQKKILDYQESLESMKSREAAPNWDNERVLTRAEIQDLLAQYLEIQELLESARVE